MFFIIINRHRCGRYTRLMYDVVFHKTAKCIECCSWLTCSDNNKINNSPVTYWLTGNCARRRHVIHIERYVQLMLIDWWAFVRSRLQITSREKKKFIPTAINGSLFSFFVYASQTVQWHCWQFVNFHRNSSSMRNTELPSPIEMDAVTSSAVQCFI